MINVESFMEDVEIHYPEIRNEKTEASIGSAMQKYAQAYSDEIVGMYYRYGEKTDADIKEFLKDVKLVALTNKGINTINGYYEISGIDVERIKTQPRKTALSFIDTFKCSKSLGDLQANLTHYKEQDFLVKSSSRMFYKPDIGEIIDQISFDDITSGKIQAINIDCSNYLSLSATQGEHFICTVELLTKAI